MYFIRTTQSYSILSAVVTGRVLLVPYEEHHVPTYHDWMQDEVGSHCHSQTKTERVIGHPECYGLRGPYN